jgi:AcrR family transcriptional regulator
MASFLVTAVTTVPFALAGPHTSLWLPGAVLVIRGFGVGAVLVPPMSVAYQDVPRAGIPDATMNTRIAQQVGASFGIAIVAVALQSLLARGATSAFQGAFWWTIGITAAALIPALALPATGPQKAADMRPIPAADDFSQGSQGSENTAMGKIPANDNKPSDNKQTRRRGTELESAILDAAWEQLIAEGYEHFTVDTVAARARTSKPVLYRRWKSREDMLRATVRHRGAVDQPAIPDTGTLRGDLLALLTQANTTRNPMAALVSSMLGSYYNQTGPTPAELRDAFLRQRGSAVEQVVNRAVERGEVDPARLTPRIIDLPFDLFRNEMMMTLKPVPDHVLRQIVDDIFIPLVTTQPPA